MKAFPTTKPLDSWGDPNAGMDLRDYFAAKAMQEILKDYFMEDRYIGDKLDFVDMYTEERVAQLAYAMANAMMEARDD
jgi:hypothetical protein